MPVPWLQIVQLVPSIVEVSRELLKRTRSLPPPAPQGTVPESVGDLVVRVTTLEENERRQAELISQMADQMSRLARAVTELHRRVIWLTVALAATAAVAIGSYFAAA